MIFEPQDLLANRRNSAFASDVLQCDRCGGVMRLMAAIHWPEATAKILACLGLPSRAPPMAPAAREPALHFDPF